MSFLNEMIINEVRACMTDMVATVISRTPIRTGEKIIAYKVMVDGVFRGYSRNTPKEREENASMGEHDFDAPAPVVVVEDPAPVVVEDPEDEIPIAQLIVRRKRTRKAKVAVAVAVASNGAVAVGFYFPEDVWRLIKSYLGFGGQVCYNTNYGDCIHTGRVFRFPLFSHISAEVVNCRRSGGVYDPTEPTAIEVRHNCRWTCEGCLKTLCSTYRAEHNDHGKGSVLYNLNSFRMDTLEQERVAWFIEKHGVEKQKEAVQAGKRHVRILADRYWNKWSMEENIADLEKYWSRYLNHLRSREGGVREYVERKCRLFNQRTGEQNHRASHQEIVPFARELLDSEQILPEHYCRIVMASHNRDMKQGRRLTADLLITESANVSAEIQRKRNPYSRHCYDQTIRRLRSALDGEEITHPNFITMSVVAEFHDLPQGGAGVSIDTLLHGCASIFIDARNTTKQ
jgi:hypothetical protein